MAKTILIVDDDVQISDMLAEVLRRAGYETLRAWSGTEALLALEKHRPALVLLDLMLPGLSGEEVLAKIKTQNLPVIVISAKGAVEDKVALLLGGAADYLTKPFDTKELLARIEVQLRAAPSPGGLRYEYGPLALDTATRAVTAAGQSVPLTKTEYAILKLLLQNPKQVLAKSTILERIAADTPDCTESTLKTHVSHLRSKLRVATGKDWIESVWGIGFKLAELEPQSVPRA